MGQRSSKEIFRLEAVEPLFREALTAYGVIDHVINNASCFERGTIGSSP